MNHIWVFCDNSANESNKKYHESFWSCQAVNGRCHAFIRQSLLLRWSGGHQNCHFVIQSAADYIFDSQWIWKSFLSCFWQISSNNLNSFLPKRRQITAFYVWSTKHSWRRTNVLKWVKGCVILEINCSVDKLQWNVFFHTFSA